MFGQGARISAFLFAIALVLACAPSWVPAVAPGPTFDPNSIQTYIVQTSEAAATQTARFITPTLIPTQTPLPTPTPSEAPSPTVTFIFVLPTPTVPTPTPEPGSTGKSYDCAVASMEPKDRSHIRPNTDFTMIWYVINMGTEFWDSNNLDYRFKTGDKLHKSSIYDFPVSVATGDQTEIHVEMKSPATPGTYSSTWVINSGQIEFCRMSVTILVP